MKRIIQRGFAWGIDQVMRAYEPRIAHRKQALLGDLTGRILEIGPGTGPNLKYFGPDVSWIGVEPNPFMHPYLRDEATRNGLEVEIVEGSAMELPLEEGSVDVVVGTLVLCSVPDPVQVLNEVHRVLRPGGKYVFIEHVAGPAGSWVARLQKFIKPIWRCCADGCHVDRRTWETVRQSPFKHIELEHFQLRFPVVGPHIMGVATREAWTTPPDSSAQEASCVGLPSPLSSEH